MTQKTEETTPFYEKGTIGRIALTKIVKQDHTAIRNHDQTLKTLKRQIQHLEYLILNIADQNHQEATT
jgi:hypothetical protein